MLYYPTAKLWAPDKIANCVLWLDANDLSTIAVDSNNLVSAWNSKVGNFTAIQNTAANQPILTQYLQNRNTITFDGVNDFLRIVSSAFPTTFFTTNFTIAVSVTFTRLLTGSGQQNIITKRTTASPTNGVIFADLGSSNNFGVDWGGFATRINLTKALLNSNTTYLLSRNNSERKVFRNGLKSVHSAGVVNPNTTSNLFIGCTENQANFLQGNINEIIMYQSFLSDAELEKLAGYLHWKWLNPDILPIGNDYRERVPKLIN